MKLNLILTIIALNKVNLSFEMVRTMENWLFFFTESRDCVLSQNRAKIEPGKLRDFLAAV